jgi:tight adherence protein B
MIYIIIVAVGVLGVLLLGSQAMSGPNPRKSLKRRVELIKERHGEGGVLAANAQAQINFIGTQPHQLRIGNWFQHR